MSLETPIKIRILQRKLYQKAKEEPSYRFYLLYDKMYREDVLAHAYALVKSNQGAPGVDGQSFWGIESQGLEEWLSGIREDLRAKTYQPQAVRRVLIPKPGGGERPLGIPTIRDRVVQTAAKLTFRTEAEIHRAHPLEAAQQKARGREQHESDGDFCDHQAGAETCESSTCIAGAPALLEGLVQVRAYGGESRRQASESACSNAQEQCERNHGPAQADFTNARQSLRQEVYEHAKGNGGERDAKQAAAQAQREAFEDGLSQKRA